MPSSARNWRGWGGWGGGGVGGGRRRMVLIVAFALSGEGWVGGWIEEWSGSWVAVRDSPVRHPKGVPIKTKAPVRVHACCSCGCGRVACECCRGGRKTPKRCTLCRYRGEGRAAAATLVPSCLIMHQGIARKRRHGPNHTPETLCVWGGGGDQSRAQPWPGCRAPGLDRGLPPSPSKIPRDERSNTELPDQGPGNGAMCRPKPHTPRLCGIKEYLGRETRGKRGVRP